MAIQGFHSPDGLHAKREDDGTVTIIIGYAPYDESGFPVNPTDSTQLSKDQWELLHIKLDPDVRDVQ